VLKRVLVETLNGWREDAAEVEKEETSESSREKRCVSNFMRRGSSRGVM